MTDAQNITLALRGHWYGSYGLAFCPAHANSRTPALSVRDGQEGRLLARCMAECSFADVAAALRGLGLLDGTGRPYRPDPAEVARRHAEEKAAREKRTRQARAVWAEGTPIGGTLAERYLRARAILGPLPQTLRFHASCWHASARRLPALLGAVHLRGDLVAVHRTYLEEPGRKADVAPSKAMLGPVAGGAVRLSGGGGPLLVAEGIETSLSLLDALREVAPRVWAALSASGMAALVLPREPGELVIAPDPDPVGRKAAGDLARRAFILGWSVRIMEPPGADLDWNDAARIVGTLGTLEPTSEQSSRSAGRVAA